MAWPLWKQLNPPSQAERLRTWLIGRVESTGCASVPIRTAMQHGPIGTRQVDHLDAALRELAAAGDVVVLVQGRRRWIGVGRGALERGALLWAPAELPRPDAGSRYMRMLRG